MKEKTPRDPRSRGETIKVEAGPKLLPKAVMQQLRKIHAAAAAAAGKAPTVKEKPKPMRRSKVSSSGQVELAFASVTRELTVKDFKDRVETAKQLPKFTAHRAPSGKRSACQHQDDCKREEERLESRSEFDLRVDPGDLSLTFVLKLFVDRRSRFYPGLDMLPRGAGEKNEVVVKVRFSVPDVDGNEVLSETAVHVFKRPPGRRQLEIRDAWEFVELEDPAEEEALLPGGKLTMHCDLQASIDLVTESTVVLRENAAPKTLRPEVAPNALPAPPEPTSNPAMAENRVKVALPVAAEMPKRREEVAMRKTGEVRHRTLANVNRKSTNPFGNIHLSGAAPRVTTPSEEDGAKEEKEEEEERRREKQTRQHEEEEGQERPRGRERGGWFDGWFTKPPASKHMRKTIRWELKQPGVTKRQQERGEKRSRRPNKRKKEKRGLYDFLFGRD